jgi:hypothetical protein
MSSPEFEFVEITRLTCPSDGLKIHTDEQIEHLRASIRKFGFLDPIGVDADYVIVDGIARFRAAAAEGMTEVPVVVLSNLSGRQGSAFALAANQIQLSTGLDAPAVQREFNRLAVEADEHLALGFSDSDILFLGLGEADPVASAPLGPAEDTAQEDAAWRDLVQPVIQTKIRFTDRTKYVQFTSMVSALRTRYFDVRNDGQALARLAAEVSGRLPY